ncbi:hypothetical protein Droror1_Dr00009738 [Drosera rotundifolia]
MIMMRKHQMASLSLLVMVTLQLESPMFFADGSARFNKLVSGSSSHGPVKTGSEHRVQRNDFVERRHGEVNGNAEQSGDHDGDHEGDGDAIWDDEKRRIRTGPNPLHNR